MSQTRYCSTCGTLLSAGAAICGECGARYQESPYERRATDAPGAWAPPPNPRSRDLGPRSEETNGGGEEEIELISAESLRPKAPGATTLRSAEQYDQMMVNQPPTNQPGSGSQFDSQYPTGAPAGAGMPSPAQPGGGPNGPAAMDAIEMDPPLDGCVPASPVKRLLSALVDSVVAGIALLPFMIGLTLILVQQNATLLAQILVGVGVALPAAYWVLIVWLQGAKGLTIGKLIVGLRITRYSQAGTIGFVRALGRAVIYGAVSFVMALSIFLDPRRHLRGFHDRAIDSVVVDIKAGRNPLKPRPDDFERAGAEHYLGSPSVAVTAHENLMAAPGAAWDAQPTPAAESGPSQPGDGPWGPGPSAPSPYAPPPAAPPAPVAGAAAETAPEPAVTTEQPPLIGSPWSPAPAVSEAPAPQPDQGWNPPPAPSPAAPAAWSPQPADPAPNAPAPNAPAPNAPAPNAPAPSTPAPNAPAPSTPAPNIPTPIVPASQGDVPAELTSDAWDAAEIDEETRLAGVGPEELGDLEQTRISALPLPQVRTLRITADNGAERVVEQAVVIGRNPTATDGEVLFVLKDETRSVSKTHLRLDGTGDELLATDLGSTNGSAIVRPDGSRESLVPNTATVVPPGSTLAIGDRVLTVEREQ